ncbi:hypothetical protein LTSEUGA_1607 [Salmonella enterica subsp. enterica serovar Uganda str. R8-3404]|uniref:FtsH protease modulator YccA n=1 Tax=Salmonella enterica subsp. enterica serovar Uganda str. R8-3404 TaxID=913083 RepID=A0A6C8H5M2_SALET|nr:hypothetical protein LTSEUGA_1607 [Salmonella enterica subsp. enterica serovar Uganda str. R8-3404]
MDRIITSSRDRSSLLSTHKVLRNTYFLLSLTLAFSIKDNSDCDRRWLSPQLPRQPVRY